MAFSPKVLKGASPDQLQNYLDAVRRRRKSIEDEIGLLMGRRVDTDEEIAIIIRAQQGDFS